MPALQSVGYRLAFREPGWHEHRLFKGPDIEINLHVFSDCCPETQRMLLFRDWLRGNAADRDLYARTKLELARSEWPDVQHYADAKTTIVEAILARASSVVWTVAPTWHPRDLEELIAIEFPRLVNGGYWAGS
jgi:GrpB-like predicted nucleotidyltransferase (UPF0157 family)